MITYFGFLAFAIFVSVGMLIIPANLQAATSTAQLQIVERFQDEVYLRTLMHQADSLAERYADEEFITSLLAAQERREQAMKDWLHTLQIHPLQIPYVGIYRSDIAYLVHATSEGFSEFFSKKLFEHYFTKMMITKYSQKQAEIIQGIKEIAASHANNPDEQKKYMQEFLIKCFDFKHKDLLNKKTISYVGISCFFDSLFEKTHDLCVAYKKPVRTGEPIPLTHVIDKFPFLALFNRSAITTIITPFLVDTMHEWGLLPKAYKNLHMHTLRKIVIHSFFIWWLITSVIFTSFIEYLVQHLPLFIELGERYTNLNTIRLYSEGCWKTQTGCPQGVQIAPASESEHQIKNNLERSAQKQLENFFIAGINMSLLTWVTLKRRKCAEWNLCAACLMAIPGFYQLGKKAYTVYTAINAENDNVIVAGFDDVSLSQSS